MLTLPMFHSDLPQRTSTIGNRNEWSASQARTTACCKITPSPSMFAMA